MRSKLFTLNNTFSIKEKSYSRDEHSRMLSGVASINSVLRRHYSATGLNEYKNPHEIFTVLASQEVQHLMASLDGLLKFETRSWHSIKVIGRNLPLDWQPECRTSGEDRFMCSLEVRNIPAFMMLTYLPVNYGSDPTKDALIKKLYHAQRICNRIHDLLAAVEHILRYVSPGVLMHECDAIIDCVPDAYQSWKRGFKITGVNSSRIRDVIRPDPIPLLRGALLEAAVLPDCTPIRDGMLAFSPVN